MRIAIVGGTFSPPHNGHVALALCARDGLNADRVLIMPNAAPPHKFCGVSKLDRREMTRLAFMDVKKTELDETELFSDGKSYTYETMAKLKALYPNDDLIFVIGGDSLRDFATWRHPDRILKIAVLPLLQGGESICRTRSAKRKKSSVPKSSYWICLSATFRQRL